VVVELVVVVVELVAAVVVYSHHPLPHKLKCSPLYIVR